jgi:hypothetical protein
MAQVFSAPGVFALKLAGLAVIVIVAAAWVALYKALPAHSGALSPQQPIAFSHKHHVGDDGIDCRYCHWSVEKSSFAGIPSAQVCLTCHSQLFSDAAILEPLRESARTGKPLAWARVHDLPDFVYFDHSIHVAKGVGCVECHGRVDRMPRIERVASLEMQWCLDCHRNPAPHLPRPTPPLHSTQRLTDCSTCHR